MSWQAVPMGEQALQWLTCAKKLWGNHVFTEKSIAESETIWVKIGG